jgi:amino acid transporter
MSTETEPLTGDDQLLEKMGYKPELKRGWSAFSNFAISMTIICILSGCLTTYGQAWNYGGPIGISIGWPVISLLVLTVGLSMAELASKFPTAGGIYYWAHQLGGPVWAWFTGWFNLLGLVAIIAAVDYGAASFSTHSSRSTTSTSSSTSGPRACRRACIIPLSCSSSSWSSTG